MKKKVDLALSLLDPNQPGLENLRKWIKGKEI